jgi:hypothetical protein
MSDMVCLSPAYVAAMVQIATMPTRLAKMDAEVGVGEISRGMAGEMVRLGLAAWEQRGTVILTSTERGDKWLAMLCDTPLPVNPWVDPREEKKS